MNTESALENVGAGDFQRLATAILAASESIYRALLETGGNAQGQTIRSGADATCRVVGSDPAHFVFAEHTTTELSALRRKWLHEPTGASNARDEGDLVKAARLARERRRDFPHSQVTVVLTSNRRINLELERDVRLCAERLGVAVDIWDQSRLIRFLDHQADGHWLRYRFLGIEAQRLSGELLRDLCKQSLNAYENFFRFSCDPTINLVKRKIEDELHRSDESGQPLRCLVGLAGYGKSTLLWRVMRARLESGGYALWLSPQHWNYTTLAGALEAQLRELYPSLLPGEGERALQIASAQRPLWVAVDDLNRLPSPVDMLHRLRAWTRPPSADSSEASPALRTGSPVVWAPLWPQVWAASGWEGRTPSWVRKLEVGTFTLSETERLLAQTRRTLSSSEAKETASDLGNDPFSLGLLLELAVERPQAPLKSLAANVVEQFIVARCHEAQSHTPALLACDFREAMRRLAWLMLKFRCLRPSWSQITTWLGGSSAPTATLSALRALVSQGDLCRLNEQDCWEFRHDRLHNVLCADALMQTLVESTDVSHCITSCGSVLAEPYFAEVVGDALVHLPQHCWNALKAELLPFVADQNPLALAVCLRQLYADNGMQTEPTSSMWLKFEDVCVALQRWAQVHTHSGKEDEDESSAPTSGEDVNPKSAPLFAPWSLRRSLYETLESVCDPGVKEIALALPDDHFRSLFLLSQGTICQSLYHETSRSFGLNDPLLAKAAIQGVARDRSGLLATLQVDLKQLAATARPLEIAEDPNPNAQEWTDETLFHGAIALVGYLQVHELETELETCWERVPNARRKTFLPVLLWSALLGLGSLSEEGRTASPLLTTLLDAWGELSDERIQGLGGATERSQVSETLRHAFAGEGLACPEQGVRHLVERGRRDSRIAGNVQWALHMTDSPLAMEFTVEQAIADYEGQDWVYWVHDLPRQWDGTMWEKRSMAPTTRERLRSLWQDETLPRVGRNLALRLWCCTLFEGDLETLAAVPKDSLLFKTAIEMRAVNGDVSCVDEFLILAEEDYISLQYADSIWCPQLLPLLHLWAERERELAAKFKHGMSSAGHVLARLLTKIPENEAEAVFGQHWEHLRLGTDIVQSALWVGTPVCLELARQAVEGFAPDRDPFQHYEMHVPVRSPFHGEPDLPDKVLRFLRNMLPYVGRLNEEKRAPLAEGCCRIGAQEWGKLHIARHLTSSQKIYYLLLLSQW